MLSRGHTELCLELTCDIDEPYMNKLYVPGEKIGEQLSSCDPSM